MSDEGGDANLLAFVVETNENFLIEAEDYDWQDWEAYQRSRTRRFRHRRHPRPRRHRGR